MIRRAVITGSATPIEENIAAVPPFSRLFVNGPSLKFSVEEG